MASQIVFQTAVIASSLLLFTGCASSVSQQPNGTADPSAAEDPERTQSPEAATAGGEVIASESELFARAMALVGEGQCARALSEAIDPALRQFERRRPDVDLVRATRSAGAGALMATIQMASEHRSGVVMGPDWPDTMYLRAFCLIELGDVGAAEQQLVKALQMMPDDFVYACELGHIQQQRREWRVSLATYRTALESAVVLARLHPEAVIFGLTVNDWRRRALRGIGFTLYELDDLDGAAEAYRQALVIDPTDEQAQAELRLIEERRR